MRSQRSRRRDKGLLSGSRGHVVSLLPSGSSVTAMKLESESESVGIALTFHLQRNKRKFGNDDRQEWSLIGKIHRESMTRRCKALFRDCYCRDVMDIDDRGLCRQCRGGVGPHNHNEVVG